MRSQSPVRSQYRWRPAGERAHRCHGRGRLRASDRPGGGLRRLRERLAGGSAGRPTSRGGERGSALVDFLLVSVLVTAIVLGIVQLALTLHVRTILTDSAASGARYAALSGHSLSDGAARTTALITSTLPAAYAEGVDVDYGNYRGVEVVEVHVSAPMPVLGMLGPGGVITVAGRALVEEA